MYRFIFVLLFVCCKKAVNDQEQVICVPLLGKHWVTPEKQMGADCMCTTGGKHIDADYHQADDDKTLTFKEAQQSSKIYPH